MADISQGTLAAVDLGQIQIAGRGLTSATRKLGRMETTMNGESRNPFVAPALTAWVGRLGFEAFDFAGNRLRKDFSAGEAACGCRSLEDLAKVQRRWLEDAFKDYAQEATKVLELTADALRPDTKA